MRKSLIREKEEEEEDGHTWLRARKVSRLNICHSLNKFRTFEEEDYSAFGLRRSERKSEEFLLQQVLTTTDDSNLNLKMFNSGSRGRGIKTSKNLWRGDLVVEYAGELISGAEAEAREKEYQGDPSKGCYMYFFKHSGKHYCLDATEETGRYGRLINHGRRKANLHTKVFLFKGVPRLVLIAKEDLQAGVELFFDYGDRDPDTLAALPWLNQ